MKLAEKRLTWDGEIERRRAGNPLFPLIVMMVFSISFGISFWCKNFNKTRTWSSSEQLLGLCDCGCRNGKRQIGFVHLIKRWEDNFRLLLVVTGFVAGDLSQNWVWRSRGQDGLANLAFAIAANMNRRPCHILTAGRMAIKEKRDTGISTLRYYQFWSTYRNLWRISANRERKLKPLVITSFLIRNILIRFVNYTKSLLIFSLSLFYYFLYSLKM